MSAHPVTPLFWAMALALLPTAAFGAATQTIVYRGGKVWTGKGFEARDLAIRDGHFVDPKRLGPNAITVSIRGRYVVPAYGNAHTHAAGPTEEASKAFTDAGVFYAWNPGSGAAAGEQKAFFDRPETYDVAFALGGISVRGGHPEKLISRIAKVPPERLAGDAYHYGETPAEIEAALDRLVEQHADFIKAYLINSEEFGAVGRAPSILGGGLNPAYAAQLVEGARKRGLRTAFHAETMSDLRIAISAGAMASMHMPAYSGYTFSAKYPEKWAVTEEDARTIARSGILMVTTYAMIRGADGRLQRGPLEQLQRKVQAENLRLLEHSGATILIGTDREGEIFTEAEHLASLAAIDTNALLKIVLGTGKHLFPKRRIGCFEAGCEADFLVLREDPSADIKALRSIDIRVKAGAQLPK